MSLNQPQQQIDDNNSTTTLIQSFNDNNQNSFFNNENYQRLNIHHIVHHHHLITNNNLKSGGSTDSSSNNEDEEEAYNINNDDDDAIGGDIEEDETNEEYDEYPKRETTTISSKKLHKDFICNICKNKLVDPKLLNCLHTFCKNCLNEQIKKSSIVNLAQISNSSLSPTESSLSGNSNNGGLYSNDDQYMHHHHHHNSFFSNSNQIIPNNHISSSSSSSTASSSNHSSTSIVCPTCKQESKVPLNGIDGFEDDYVMLNMLDMLAIEDMIMLCTSCKEQETAVARCADCSSYLCSSCVKAHEFMRLFEKHRVVKFDDFKKNGINIHKPLYCRIHEKECLKYYCITCDTPICSDCIGLEHQAPLHNYIRLNEVGMKNFEHLDILVNEAKNKLKYCQEQYTTLDGHLADLQEQLESSRGNIDETYQSYKAILEKRRDDMLRELENEHAKKELLIMDLHDSIGKSIKKINDVVGFTERVYKNGNNLEVLLLKKHISNQIQHITKNLPVANIDVSCQFNTDKSLFEKAVYDYFGYFLNDKQQKEQQQQQLQLIPQMISQFYPSPHDEMNIHHQSPLSIEQEFMNLALDSQKGVHYIDDLSPESPSNSQKWLMNVVNQRSNGVLTFDDHSPESPSNEWCMNMNMANLAKTTNSLNTNQMILNNLSNVNHYLNQRPPSPIEALNNFMMNQQNGLQPIVTSRSQTPCISSATNNLDDFMPFNNSSMSQNINQLSKLVAPISSSHNGGTSLSITSNSPPMSETNQQFAGNGNLNPPVRSVKMAHMQIRTKFGSLGPSKSQFHSPHGFCLGVDEEIIVADTNNHRIQIFDKSGVYKSHFGMPGREEGQLWYPRKVTVMRASGKFVVCDRGNERSRMQIFSKTGNFIKKIAIRYIDIVAGLAITNEGNIVAVDSVSPTVFCISEAGDLLKWFDCSEHMREPSDIAISGKEYYVCDFKGHSVVVFDDDGNYLRKIGSENVTNFPNGIDVSDAGDVLVGDSHGNRFHVAVFTREGELISEFECPYVKVSRCCGLKITSEGYVVTLAKNNHHVLVLNTLYVA